MVETSTKTAPKRATNISLSLDVYESARELGMNISQLCDQLLREAIRVERARRWADEHADFIDAYNRLTEAEGLPLDQWRSF
ncbi:Post-segregation antitoxin (ccd killing mechanism protein) encoded by the F plasmid [Bordetella ansorpii]|uniref:Post-segregation antitoxin (Ccd killing mechanism protein) encoded by the F plasmid n=1 Tax=Bordetella ansorpii TaxID=288768 RepID=A0A157LKL6_9BORD|nr:type II toxin-antitoxin system CcdA family antitoxin [Bordetella ansorpii]SAH97074.1 Post-segregation antitoxin (ccd killing mechanism protein) encoded by the F plasmid [Bordetella ansorpii]